MVTSSVVVEWLADWSFRLFSFPLSFFLFPLGDTLLKDGEVVSRAEKVTQVKGEAYTHEPLALRHICTVISI